MSTVGEPPVAEVVITPLTGSMPGSNGAVSSNRSNTAITAVTLANGSQFHVPMLGSVASAPQVHQLLALACRQSVSGGRSASNVPPSAPSAIRPFGRQASPETIAVTHSGVSALIVVGVVPPWTIVNSSSSGAPGLTPWLCVHAAAPIYPPV